MIVNVEEILEASLNLPAIERADLINHLLSSLDVPDKGIDGVWQKEVEERIEAYRKGHLTSISLQDVLSKYQK